MVMPMEKVTEMVVIVRLRFVLKREQQAVGRRQRARGK